ncbi:MAG: MATE family efflux transporter [Candidatus Choladocola sp.]|nr:MATE family efflux transporter [Clostridiaceae bacterium]MDY4547065.1 MATE family efflux transporter [Candidatus Choladocola sp.]
MALVGIFVNLIVGLAVGPNAALANLIGQNKREKISGMLHTILTFGAVLGIVLMGVGMLTARTVLEASGTPESVMADALIYIRIYFLGLLPVRMWYMYKNKVCTLIDVDEVKQIVQIKNYADNIMFRAFGSNQKPDIEDYREFLESRCFPRTRDKMKLVLRDLGIPFYDPYLIIQKTEGRMAEDDFWIRIEK